MFSSAGNQTSSSGSGRENRSALREDDVRDMGRTARGVRKWGWVPMTGSSGWRSSDRFKQNPHLVSEKGHGKRTKISYRLDRGGGRRTIVTGRPRSPGTSPVPPHLRQRGHTMLISDFAGSSAGCGRRRVIHRSYLGVGLIDLDDTTKAGRRRPRRAGRGAGERRGGGGFRRRGVGADSAPRRPGGGEEQ